VEEERKNGRDVIEEGEAERESRIFVVNTWCTGKK
jgi:hypothetical protein